MLLTGGWRKQCFPASSHLVCDVTVQVVKPLDLQGNLAERIFSDDKYSQFQLALFVADMINQLHQTDRTFTVLAPTDQAFAKLPREILDLILTDANTAESEWRSRPRHHRGQWY